MIWALALPDDSPLVWLARYLWWATMTGIVFLLLVWAWSAWTHYALRRKMRRRREEAKERHIESRRQRLLYPSRGMRRRDRR